MISDFVLRRNNQRGYGVYTTKNWKKGEKLHAYEGNVIPNYMASTLRSMTIDKYFSLEWQTGGVQCYFNHSCNPNGYISWENGMPNIIARRDISFDEEVCYNYNTTELSLSGDWTAFPCHCGDKDCIGWIRGFLLLTPKQKSEIVDMLSPWVKKHE